MTNETPPWARLRSRRSRSSSLSLRRSQLRADTSGSVELLIGTAHPLRLPCPLASLAQEHLAALPESDARGWLFPGRMPGRARDPQYLSRYLRALETSISELQRTARFRLAGAVPAKVLADMLNFHISTFETYAHLAAGNRGEYPTLRSHTSPSHPD